MILRTVISFLSFGTLVNRSQDLRPGRNARYQLPAGRQTHRGWQRRVVELDCGTQGAFFCALAGLFEGYHLSFVENSGPVS